MHGNVRLSQCRVFVQKSQPGIFRQIQRLDEFQSEADSHRQSDLDHHLLHFLPSNRHDRAYYYFYTVKKRKVDPHCP